MRRGGVLPRPLAFCSLFASEGVLSFPVDGGEFRAPARVTFGNSLFCLRRPLFFQQRKKRGKETPPKTTFLDFLARLHVVFILQK